MIHDDHAPADTHGDPERADRTGVYRGATALLAVAATVLAVYAAYGVPLLPKEPITALIWGLGPAAVAVTLAAGLWWLFAGDCPPSDARVLPYWALGGSLCLGFGGLMGVTFQYLHGLTPTVDGVVVAGWACGGFVIGTVVGAYDVRRRVEERRVAAERRKAERLAETLGVLNRVLRHDIRNDANVIRGYLDLVAAETDADPTHVAAIRNRTDRIVQLADHARDVEALVASGDDGAEAVDVGELTRRVVTDARTIHPHARIRVDAPEETRVAAHGLLDVALRNLVENAVEHNPTPRPTVDVTVETGSTRTVVSVADDGPGIPSHEARVIERGFEDALRHSSGMGLWLTAWIVRRSGGSVDLRADDDGGSTVLLRLRSAPTPNGRPGNAPDGSRGARSREPSSVST